MNPVELFIARRYLTTKRNVRFINVIGYVSILGIATGVAALLIALSVFNGFSGVVTRVLVGFDPHIRIEKKGNINSTEYASVENVLKSHSEIRAYAPFVSGKAMLVARGLNKVVLVRGVDEKTIGEVSGLRQKIVLGSLAFDEPGRTPSIVVGLTLADRLGSVVDDELVVYSPSSIQTAFQGVGTPEGTKFRVAGIFESDNKDYDADYTFVSIRDGQRLFNLEGMYSGIEIRLGDFNNAEHVKQMLLRELPSDLTIATWYDLHQSLYTVMRVERWSAFVLLTLIIVVATFNMLGSLTMGVIEKRRDIAVLKSMGMTSKGIVRTFMVEGMFIGAIGTIFGIILGLIVLFLQVEYQLFPLDTTIYIIPAIPVEIRWTDFIAIAAASLGLSYLAAYYPARRAAFTPPAEALRWE